MYIIQLQTGLNCNMEVHVKDVLNFESLFICLVSVGEDVASCRSGCQSSHRIGRHTATRRCLWQQAQHHPAAH